MFLKVSFLSEVDPTGSTLEWPDPLVYPLVHVPITGRGKDLPAGLTRVLPLFQFLMTLFMSLVMTPQSERLGTQRTSNWSLIADSLLT